MEVVKIPTTSLSDRESIEKVLTPIMEDLAAGKLKGLVVVAFNQLGGFQDYYTSNLTKSNIALASATIQAMLTEWLNRRETASYPTAS